MPRRRRVAPGPGPGPGPGAAAAAAAGAAAAAAGAAGAAAGAPTYSISFSVPTTVGGSQAQREAEEMVRTLLGHPPAPAADLKSWTVFALKIVAECYTGNRGIVFRALLSVFLLYWWQADSVTILVSVYANLVGGLLHFIYQTDGFSKYRCCLTEEEQVSLTRQQGSDEALRRFCLQISPSPRSPSEDMLIQSIFIATPLPFHLAQVFLLGLHSVFLFRTLSFWWLGRWLFRAHFASRLPGKSFLLSSTLQGGILFVNLGILATMNSLKTVVLFFLICVSFIMMLRSAEALMLRGLDLRMCLVGRNAHSAVNDVPTIFESTARQVIYCVVFLGLFLVSLHWCFPEVILHAIFIYIHRILLLNAIYSVVLLFGRSDPLPRTITKNYASDVQLLWFAHHWLRVRSTPEIFNAVLVVSIALCCGFHWSFVIYSDFQLLPQFSVVIFDVKEPYRENLKYLLDGLSFFLNLWQWRLNGYCAFLTNAVSFLTTLFFCRSPSEVGVLDIKSYVSQMKGLDFTHKPTFPVFDSPLINSPYSMSPLQVVNLLSSAPARILEFASSPKILSGDKSRIELEKASAIESGFSALIDKTSQVVSFYAKEKETWVTLCSQGLTIFEFLSTGGIGIASFHRRVGEINIGFRLEHQTLFFRAKCASLCAKVMCQQGLSNATVSSVCRLASKVVTLVAPASATAVHSYATLSPGPARAVGLLRSLLKVDQERRTYDGLDELATAALGLLSRALAGISKRKKIKMPEYLLPLLNDLASCHPRIAKILILQGAFESLDCLVGLLKKCTNRIDTGFGGLLASALSLATNLIGAEVTSNDQQITEQLAMPLSLLQNFLSFDFYHFSPAPLMLGALAMLDRLTLNTVVAPTSLLVESDFVKTLYRWVSGYRRHVSSVLIDDSICPYFLRILLQINVVRILTQFAARGRASRSRRAFPTRVRRRLRRIMLAEEIDEEVSTIRGMFDVLEGRGAGQKRFSVLESNRLKVVSFGGGHVEKEKRTGLSLWMAGCLKRIRSVVVEPTAAAAASECECECECVVCMESLAHGEPVIVLSCTHTFHPGCIRQWSLQDASCPTCRLRIILPGEDDDDSAGSENDENEDDDDDDEDSIFDEDGDEIPALNELDPIDENDDEDMPELVQIRGSGPSLASAPVPAPATFLSGRYPREFFAAAPANNPFNLPSVPYSLPAPEVPLSRLFLGPPPSNPFGPASRSPAATTTQPVPPFVPPGAGPAVFSVGSTADSSPVIDRTNGRRSARHRGR